MTVDQGELLKTLHNEAVDALSPFDVQLKSCRFGYKSIEPPSWVKLFADLSWRQQVLHSPTRWAQVTATDEETPVKTLREASSNRTLAGKCLCGAVHYAVIDEFRYALNCHCSNCRRTTGSAFKPFAGIERDKLHITKGEESVLIFGDEITNDTRCKVCGSLLYSVVRDGAFVHVTMGTLVDDPTIRPSAHIFVGSKASWFTITDYLPQHEELG